MFEKIKFYIKKAWAPTLVVTIIFFIHYFFFGRENTAIGPFVTLTFLKLRGMQNYKGCMVKNFAVYVAMACLAFGALLNPVCNIVINAGALFWIAYFLIDEFHPTNYFPAGMALVFFQIAPAKDVGALFWRILALAVAFMIIFLFLLVLERQHKLSRVSDQVVKGLEISQQLYESLTKLHQQCLNQAEDMQANTNIRDEAAELRNQLCQVNRGLCDEIYQHNRSQLGNKVAANKYCYFVAAFRIICSLTEDYLDRSKENCIENIGSIVQRFRWIYRHMEDEGRDLPLFSERKLKIRVNRPDIRSFRLRFALRQVCVITPCLAFGYLTDIPNRYWLAVSVFFMMIPLYERTFGRIAQRMRGTLFGVILCVILFAFFRTIPQRILLMTIFNFLIYCSGSYATMVVCITCSALSMNFPDNYLVMLLLRVLYTLVGALIAWAGNVWVFPIRATRQIEYLKGMFEDICVQMRAAMTLPEAEKAAVINQLIIRSHLLTDRMEDLNAALPADKKCADCHEFLKEHLRRIAHLIFVYG